jgi:hypothetical protein
MVEALRRRGRARILKVSSGADGGRTTRSERSKSRPRRATKQHEAPATQETSYLRCSYYTICRLVRAGKVPAFKLAKDHRVHRSQPEKYSATNCATSAWAFLTDADALLCCLPPAIDHIRPPIKLLLFGRHMGELVGVEIG